jgi:hypothetical protein
LREYDVLVNYSQYVVTKDDLPLVSTRAAAQALGRSSETVRQMIKTGKLPARRSRDSYNQRYEIPAWAVRGLASVIQARTRGYSQGPPLAEDGGSSALHARLHALEDALASLTEAREHEQRAFEHQLETIRALQRANSALSRAVSGVLVPSQPPEPDNSAA